MSNCSHNQRGNWRLRQLLVSAVMAFFILSNYVLVRSQNGATDLKGKTQTVVVVPYETKDAGEIRFKADTDHDGMSDEDELRNGTDPNNPADADADTDGDGLSNADEVAAGTNLNTADSDGDGVSDNEEVRLGFNPLDPASTPPTGVTVVSLQVTPSPLSLNIDLLSGPASAQLTVIGVLNNGSTTDLTRTPGTTYQSLTPSVATVDTNGVVLGLASGATSIIARNGDLSAQTAVVVSVFTPQQVGSIRIPGFANNLEVAGNYVYVAAGSAGLQILNVSDRRLPDIIAALDTPGNTNDVKLVGNLAYLADGTSGLQIINVSNPNNPVLLGSIDTPGEAWDVTVSGTTAYIADGSTGLQIINVTDPQNPTLLGSIDTPGTAKDVGISGSIAVIADGSGGVRVIDVSNPSTPISPGSLATVDARDVVIEGSLAYIADSSGSLKVVDFSSPSAPTLRGSTSTSQVASMVGIAKAGAFAFGINNTFTAVATVPIIEVSNPSTPLLRSNLTFSTDYRGTGVAVDEHFVYLTANRSFQENGTSGDSHLYIGRYLISNDGGNQPLVVTVVSPVDGQTVNEGTVLELAATAIDDSFVTAVQFVVNGNVVATDTTAPYQVFYTAAAGVATLTISATAFDAAGNTANASPITVNVTSELPHRVTLLSPPEGARLIEGEMVELLASSSDSRVGEVAYAVNGMPLRISRNEPMKQRFMVPLGVSSLTITATTSVSGETVMATRIVEVIPDPLTTAQGRVVDDSGAPVAGADVTLKLNGLKAEFYRFDAPLTAFPDLSGRTPDATKLVAGIDFRNPGNLFNTDTVGAGVGPYYAVRFPGLFKFHIVSNYGFTLGTKGRARLVINGTNVVEANGEGSFTEASGSFRPVSNNAISLPIMVEYFHNEGDAELQFLYTPPGTSFGEKLIVPAWDLYVSSFTAVSNANGAFSIPGIPSIMGSLRCAATASVNGRVFKGGLSQSPVPGGTAEVGNIAARVPARVGYYDMSRNRGSVSQVPPIEAAGLQAFDVGSLDTANLNAYDVLFVINGSSYPIAYTANLQKIFDFVSTGGVLVFHDQRIRNAQTVLPRVPGLVFPDSFDRRNINVVDDTTKVTKGQGGLVNQATLDSTTFLSVSLGYVVANSLPSGAKGILSRSNASQLVTFAYPHGRGWVVYSTIPLQSIIFAFSSYDYLNVIFQDVYTPSVLSYADELRMR